MMASIFFSSVRKPAEIRNGTSTTFEFGLVLPKSAGVTSRHAKDFPTSNLTARAAGVFSSAASKAVGMPTQPRSTSARRRAMTNLHRSKGKPQKILSLGTSGTRKPAYENRFDF